jgi:hypothetical protein
MGNSLYLQHVLEGGGAIGIRRVCSFRRTGLLHTVILRPPPDCITIDPAISNMVDELSLLSQHTKQPRSNFVEED